MAADDWVDEALAGASGWFGSLRWENELAALSDEQLLQSRDETRFVLELFGGFSLVLDKLIGRGAFGLSVLGETTTGMEPPSGDSGC